MSDSSQAPKQSVAAEGRHDQGTMLFGSLAFIGAGASLVFCYAQVLISLIAPLFGLGAFEKNLHLQAVFMWGFGLVAVVGLRAAV